MIRFHPNITLSEASQALVGANLVMLPDWHGGAVIMRRVDAAAMKSRAETEPEQHGNLNIVRFPRHRLQIIGAKHPGPKEIEET